MLLKVTKTSLYNLVLKYVPLPGMKHAEFRKTPRTTSYFLDWEAEGHGRAYLSACMGAPLLTIENAAGRQMYRLTVEDLRVRGMLIERKDKPCRLKKSTN